MAALTAAGPSAAGAASLNDELQGLITSHPQIQAKAKTVNSSEEAIRGARGDYLPTAKLSGDQGHEYIDSPDRRLTQGRPFFDKRHTSSLTVTQKIFDGFKTSSNVDAAVTGHAISSSDLRSTRQTTILEGAIAYLEILRQTKLVALSRETERRIAEQRDLEDERVQKGAGIASDVLAAKQRLQIAKERRVNSEGAFQAAVARFIQVFGHAPDVATLTDPPMPMELVPETMEDSVDVAERENPSLYSASRTIDLTDDKRRVAEAGYWPTLDLVGKADYENGKNAAIGPRRDWSLLLVANWELFSGFKTDAAVAQASWDHAASKDNRNYTSRKVSEAVRIAWHKLQTSRQRLELLENAAILAEEVWEAAKLKEAKGKATVQEVLDEETRINDARIAYTGAFYDMYQATYELLSGMGRLEVDSLSRASPAPAPNLAPSGASGARMAPLSHRTSDARQAPRPVLASVPPPAAVTKPVDAPVLTPQAQNEAMMQQVRGLMAPRDDFWKAGQP